MAMSRNKKAFLKTLNSVGMKVFNMGIFVSIIMLPLGKEQYKDLWQVLVPLGIVGLAVGLIAGWKLNANQD